MKRAISIFLAIVLSVSFLGCIGGDDDSDNVETSTLPPKLVQVDGVVTTDEYEHMESFSGGRFVLYWRFYEENVVFAMVARTEGMVSLGIDPEVRMKGADMMIGWVKDGETFLFDCYSTGETGPHPEDTDLGGTDDIIEYMGTENDGVTIIEFSRPLQSIDEFDKDIVADGSFYVIWAISNSDSLTSSHNYRGGATINEEDGNAGGY